LVFRQEPTNVFRINLYLVAQALRTAFENETTMSPAAYIRAVSQGDPTRLRLALRKLVAGVGPYRTSHLYVHILVAATPAKLMTFE
jgi:hypothetical protein